MNLVQWDPFKDFDVFFDRYRDDARGGRDAWRSTSAVNEWAPLVDIREDASAYRVDLEIPSVDPKDVSVTLEEGVLTITGERTFEDVSEGERVHRRERRYGSFSRSFRLPEDADEDAVSAQAKNGVVSVSVAKREKPGGRVIDVDVG